MSNLATVPKMLPLYPVGYLAAYSGSTTVKRAYTQIKKGVYDRAVQCTYRAYRILDKLVGGGWEVMSSPILPYLIDYKAAVQGVSLFKIFRACAEQVKYTSVRWLQYENSDLLQS